MSEMQQRKIGKSKKYATGKIHETGGGRIEILDRFLEDDEIMLRYRNLETNEEITNKEVNVSRLVYDYQQKKKAERFEQLEGEIIPEHVDMLEITAQMQRMEELMKAQHEELEGMREDLSKMSELIELSNRQAKMIEKLLGGAK
ncbi:hypothetical protein COE80_19555 [Bacillus pseudomycoides]|uniref:hypothetical protein n=1 Tax=Bacillus pseudomycoides TaxID=64104 RepID=UPI000BFD797F|nr:hypothetical protein [Bacillus pseudomycoides]PHB23111.1 hypothetical protein COE80_19555 [Bacillus pseudomycoides]PHE37640.1 hypothetical protein COF51_16520 [Bacillus pseudomycoides]